MVMPVSLVMTSLSTIGSGSKIWKMLPRLRNVSPLTPILTTMSTLRRSVWVPSDLETLHLSSVRRPPYCR